MRTCRNPSTGIARAIAWIPNSPLSKLPNEILQMVAARLPSDLDVLRLSMTCKELYMRVLDPDSPVWRERFGAKYDIPKGRICEDLITEYKIRAIVLPQNIEFQEEAGQQKIWLHVIQTMLLEFLTLPLEPGAISKTYRKIQEVVVKVDFLTQPKRSDSSDLFCAVQLCLTSLALDMVVSDCCLRTEYDIGAVYSYNRDLHGPFIDHDALDLTTLLHMRNFWQRHVLTPHEGTFYSSFSLLPESLKPKVHKLNGFSDPSNLSTSWLGYYSCIHPLPETLGDLQTRQTCADLDSHWEHVELMRLEFRINTGSPFWPPQCNEIIPQREGLEKERVYFDGVQRIHGGTSNTENPLFGFIEPIAFPYGGFSGWTRICFTICEQQNTDMMEDDVEHTAFSPWVHGYEAVILPGGRIMMGRWVDLKNPSGRGPFIFWDT